MYQNSSKLNGKWRRTLALVLCLIMTLSTVAVMGGCAKKDTTPANDSTTPADNSGNTAADTPADNASDDEVQTEPVKFVIRGLNDIENKSTNEAVYQKIREASGVDFEVIVIPTDSWSEKVNLMIATGDEWDVLNITQDAGNWNQYYQKNALQSWNDYLDYMPNVANRLNDESLKGCTLADGSIYALPRKEYFSKQYVPAIRKDWLDALGMECPTTMEELEAYFQGVLDENLNGSDNEIPMMTFMSGEISNLRPYYLGFFGDRYLTSDGTIMPWYMHENCYQLLAELNKWYDKGWLYADYQTMSIQDGFDLIAANRVGGWTNPYNAGVSSSVTIFENDPDAKVEWVSLDNLTDFPAGGSNAWGSNPVYQPELVLNAGSKNAKWAAKLLNWMFENEDNYMLCARGEEGVTWNYVDDTKAEFKLVDNYSDLYLGVYLLNEWYDDDTYCSQYIDPANWKASQVKALQTKINSLDIVEACDWFVPYDMTGTEAEFLSGDSNTTINEACAKIVTGEWGEDEWNAAAKQAWDAEGNIYSAVWTEQYHEFVG